MKTINELIKELKDTQIHKYKLSEICNFVSGERITKDECCENKKYPIISGGENIMGYADKYNFSGDNITVSRYGKAGYVSFHKGDIWVNDVAWVLEIIDRHQVDIKFLYYLLLAHQKEIYAMILDGTIPPHISPIAIKNFEVIIPDIDSQIKIANILDKFAELEAELEARKKQYKFWLNYLVNPSSWKKWDSTCLIQIKKIGEIATTQRGRVIAKDLLKEFNNFNFPVYSSKTLNNGILGYLDSYDYDGTYITWTTDGEKAGEVFYHQNEKFNVTNVCGLIKLNSKEINLKFLYYWLKVNLKNYVNRSNPIPKMMSNVLENVKVSIPPNIIQQKILNILTPLDLLSQNLENGIPAEIKLRNEQYHYYLKQLLCFDRQLKID